MTVTWALWMSCVKRLIGKEWSHHIGRKVDLGHREPGERLLQDDLLRNLWILSFDFIYLFLALLGLCCCSGFSLVMEREGCHLVECMPFLLWWLLFVVEYRLEVHRLSHCGARA